MARIVIIGAGVMGSALAVPAADNGHEITLVGTPLDDEVIRRLKSPGGVHPKLDSPLAPSVRPVRHDEVSTGDLNDADVLVAGVSSPGIGWFCDFVERRLARMRPVAFVTKGLDEREDALASYADTLPGRLAKMQDFIGIGGPCIARELANRKPTLSIYAAADRSKAEALKGLMQTDYYRLATTDDAPGVEASAALKNFYAIGVSAMQTRYPDHKRGDGQSKNPCAAAFSLAVTEMADIVRALGGRVETAYGLAGLGDLHVTVGGGRNSRLGHGLGLGRPLDAVLQNDLAGETVEGVDTARRLAPWLIREAGHRKRFPLASAIIRTVLDGGDFDFDFAALALD